MPPTLRALDARLADLGIIGLRMRRRHSADGWEGAAEYLDKRGRTDAAYIPNPLQPTAPRNSAGLLLRLMKEVERRRGK